MSEIYSFPDDDTSMDEWISNDLTSPIVGWNAIVFMTGSSNEDCADFKDKFYKLRSVIGEIRYEGLINGNCYQCNEKTYVCLKEKKFKAWCLIFKNYFKPGFPKKFFLVVQTATGFKWSIIGYKEIRQRNRVDEKNKTFTPEWVQSQQHFTTKFVMESLRRFETSIEWNG